MVNLESMEHWPMLAELVVVTARKEAWRMPMATMMGRWADDEEMGWRGDEE
jgi:hypothetical protein